MWNDPIVEEVHRTRAELTLKAGDDSHALTRMVQEMTIAAAAKYRVVWKPVAVPKETAQSEAEQVR